MSSELQALLFYFFLGNVCVSYTVAGCVCYFNNKGQFWRGLLAIVLGMIGAMMFISAGVVFENYLH